MRAVNVQDDNVMNALEGLRLSEKELELAEKYLKGEASEDVLADIRFQSMIDMPLDRYKPAKLLLNSYIMKKRYEEAARFLRLLYAVSAYTCSECFDYIQYFVDAVKDGGLQIDRSIALAIYAQYLYRFSYSHSKDFTPSRFIITDQLEFLAEFARRDPAIVEKALQDFDRQLANGNILLYTLYFYLRYNGEEVTGKDIQPVRDAGGTAPASVQVLPRIRIY